MINTSGEVRFHGSTHSKLDMVVFPTIRLSDTYPRPGKYADVVVSVDGTDYHTGMVEIVAKEWRLINTIPDRFLMHDMGTNSRKEAIEDLNQYWDTEITEETEVLILWSKWLKDAPITLFLGTNDRQI